MLTRALVVAAAVSCVLGLVPAGAAAQQTPPVPIVQVPSAGDFLSPQWVARAAAAKAFFANHADAYDFLVFVPVFPVGVAVQEQSNLKVGGRHYLVRNDVNGIGTPILDLGAYFGSAGRLKAVIELYSLVPGMKTATVQEALVTMAHEVGHQWSSTVSFRDPTTGARDASLLTTDGAHWSYFLDSDGSVMYGADWLDAGGGSFLSQGAQRRYSNLDLYLMGYLAPSEVAPFVLIDPVAGLSVNSDTFPPTDGAQVQGRARTIRVDDVIAAEGARSPDWRSAQQSYRAAFVILADADHAPTADQLAFVESVRQQWANAFFFMTRGRGIMETQLVERGAALASDPSPAMGVKFLLARQGAPGEWQDDAGTVIRDSGAATEALSAYGADPAVAGARSAGARFLSTQNATDNDSRARIRLGLSAAQGAPPALALSPRNADGGYGLAPGYESTPMDSVLAALAIGAGAGTAVDPALVSYLLAVQRGDGGWGELPGLASDVETTAWALRALAPLAADPLVQIAAASGIEFLRSRQGPDGSLSDAPVSPASFTAEAVLALDAWGMLGESTAGQAAQYLLSTQLADGSWDESVYETSVVVRALRILLTPNLAIEDLTLSRTSVVDGEPVQVTAVVRNTGRASASSVHVRAYDSSGVAFGSDLVIPALQGGQSVPATLLLDTTGRAGSEQVFVVVDPDGAIDELRQDDNRASGTLHVAPVPQQPDLYVAAGSLVANPPAVDTLPAHVQIAATIGNLGMTGVGAVPVTVYVRDQAVATTSVALPPRSSLPLQLDVQIPAGPSPIVIRLGVDPDNAILEAAEDNNTASIMLPAVPSVDLAVVNLAAAPSTAEQGQTVTISYAIRNTGTLAASGTTDEVRISTPDGSVAALIDSSGLSIPPGATLTRSASWRAGVAGGLNVTVSAAHPAERTPGDNIAQTAIVVTPSTKPNLVVRPEDLVVTPDPVLEGTTAVAKLTVTNVGGVAAGPFHMAFFQGDTSHLVAKSAVPGLAPGAAAAVSASYAVASDADLVVLAQADSDLEVDEHDESDNMVARTIPVLGAPDLVLDSGAIAPSNAFPRQNEAVTVTVTVRNEGGQQARPSTVSLYDGAPESGGVLIGASGLASLDAGTASDASFTWKPGTLGSHELVAIVTATGTEARTDNNRAERSIAVQNVDLAISNPYFSPNGDGVKDSTEISYRASANAAVVAEVYGPDGALVTSLPSAATGPGSIVWDGRDPSGRVVPDAKYRIVVRASVSGAFGGELGALDAVVDDNRSQLPDAIGTPLLSIEDLDRSMPPSSSQGSQREVFAPFPGDQGLVQLVCIPGQPCDFYLQEVGAGGLTRLTDGHLPEGFIWNVSVSKDGSKLAFYLQDWWSSNSLWVYSLGERTYNRIATGCASVVAPMFASDGNSLVYATNTWPVEIHVVAADGSQDRLLANGPINDFNVSPDGTLLSLESQDYGGALLVQSLDGSAERVVATGYTPIDGGVFGYRSTPSHSWAPDGASIYFIGNLPRPRWMDPYVTGIFRVRSAGGVPEMIASTAWYADELSVSPTGDAIAFAFDGKIFVEAPSGSEPRVLADNCFEMSWGGTNCPGYSYVGFSPQGSFMYALDWGAYGRRAFTTLANLTARLVATQKPGDSFMTFQGTAADANFEQFTLRARLADSGAPFTTIRSSAQPVINDVFAQWAPPGNGVYEAELTVTDKAGNARARTVRFGWSGDPAIANITRAPQFISPNADGVQDSTRIRFTVRKPTTVEVQAVSAAGALVRRIPATYVASGDYAIDWDGLSDAGTLVPDGTYTLRIADQSFPVVVDTTRPKVEIALGDSLAPSPGTEFGLLAVNGIPLLGSMRGDVFPDGYDAFLNVAARASDENLAEWDLSEVGSASGLTVATGSDEAAHQFTVPIAWARGNASRLLARDLAGNVAFQDVTPPERLYALGLAAPEADALDPSAYQYGLSLDGGAPYRNVLGAFFGIATVSIPPGQVDLAKAQTVQAVCSQLASRAPLTVFFASSIGSPLASVGLSYKPAGTDVWMSGRVTPTIDADEAAFWDTSTVASVDDLMVKVQALDVTGRFFESPEFRVKCGPKPVVVGRCMSGSALSVGFKPETVPAGTSFRLALKSVSSGRNLAIAPTVLDDATRLVVQADLPGPDCKYDVAVSSAMPDGTVFSQDVGRFDRCAAFIVSRDLRHSPATVLVEETFATAVQDVEVYASSPDVAGGAARLVGRTGPFFGTSAAVPIDVQAFAAGGCPKVTFGLVTVLPDGSRIDERSRSDRPLCGDVPLPCGSLFVDAQTTKDATARCVSRAPLYSAAIHGVVNGTFTDLAAELVAPTGAHAADVSVSGFAPGSTIGGTATISLSGLLDGPYFVHAVAHDATGASYSATSPALTADRTPPIATITPPVPGGAFCPSNGPLKVNGAVSDANLQSYSVWLRPAGGGGDARVYAANGAPGGVLATFDLGGLVPGDYLLGLEARDGGGNATCPTEVPLRIPAEAAVASLAASPPAFSPDGDGVLDGTTVSFSARDFSSVVLSLVSPSGAKLPIAVLSPPAGDEAFSWNGKLADGSRAPDGPYILEADAPGLCGGAGRATTAVFVDTTPPVARIDDPAPAATIATAGAILGAVVDPNLAGYRVSLGAGSAPASFDVLSMGTASVVGPLGALPLSGRPAGQYTVRLEAWDTVGHASETRTTFEWAPGRLIQAFDVTPAAVSPNGDGVKDSAVASVLLASPAGLSLDLLDASGAVVAPMSSTAGASGAQSVRLDGFANVPDGDYLVRASASAAAWQEAAVRPLSIDRIPPTIDVSTPAAGGFVSGGTIIAARVEDQHLASWRVSRLPGGTAQPVASGTNPVDGVLGVLAGLSDGTYQVEFVAEDVAGNHLEKLVGFTSDSTPPVVALTSPVTGSFVSSRSGPLMVTGNIVEAHLAHWRLEASRGADAWDPVADGSTVPAAGVLALWDLRNEPNGPVTLRLTAVDLAGNESSTSESIIIDNLSPAAVIAAPRDVAVPTLDELTGTVADENLVSWTLELSDGVPGTAYRFVPIAHGTSAVANGVLASVQGQLAEGAYTARLTAVDRAGNEQVDEAGFFIDRTPPRAPPALQAILQPKNDIVLTWQASPDADVVGYRILRSLGQGAAVGVGPSLVQGTTWTDVGLRDGTYQYTVVAVDAASLESGPSPAAVIDVDTTPPVASIYKPGGGSAVHGFVDVVGTAASDRDFKEYRLEVGVGPTPATFTLVRRSAAGVNVGVLGTYDTTTVVSGSTLTFRLEAEDLAGNVAESRTTVAVDNDPPPAPVLVSATVQGGDVSLTWQASEAADVAGYLVYRNGAPVSVPAGTDLTDARPYVLPSGTTTWIDKGAPDGTFSYQVQAVDTAANLSALSNAMAVTVERRAPRATVVSPAALGRVTGPFTIVADAVDQDVASVQVEVRPGGAGSFTAVGAPLTVRPYVVTLDPSTLSSPVLELRARATDTSGKTDSAPVSTFAFFAPSLAAPSVAPQVDQSSVSVTWQDPNPSGRAVGFAVQRGGAVLAPSATSLSGSATASYTYSGTPGAALDGNYYSCWSPGYGTAYWQLTFAKPGLVSGIDVYAGGGTFDVLLSVQGVWVPVATQLRQTGSTPVHVSVAPPILGSAFRVSFTSPNQWNSLCEASAQSVVTSGTPVAETVSTAGDVTLQYDVTAWGAFGQSATGSAVARIYAPTLAPATGVVGDASFVATGANATANAAVTLFRAGAPAGSGQADADGRFTITASLAPGDNVLTAQATDALGNRSRLSDPVTVRYEPPPDVGIALSLAGVSGSDVSLAFSVTGDTSAVGSYQLIRTTGGTDRIVGTTSSAGVSFTDRNVPNGTHTYRVKALSPGGIAGSVSNSVVATVAVRAPVTPVLSIAVPSTGGELDLSWSFQGAARFRLERATGGATFVAVDSTDALAFADHGVTNGVLYQYRVFAIDSAGNESPPSNVVSGVPSDLVAPGRPVILQPTVAGSPLGTSARAATISGFAERNSTVELTQNARYAGSALADQPMILARPVATAYAPSYRFEMAGSGEPLAYGYYDAQWKTYIAVEWPTQKRVVTLAVPGWLAAGPYLSPDARHVAFLAYDAAYRTTVQIGDVETGAVTPLLAADPGGESSLSWSPDSTRVAYLAPRPAAAIVVTDLATGTESVTAVPSGGASRLGWISSGALGFIGNSGASLVRLDVGTGARQVIASAPYLVTDWTATPDGAHVAALLADYSYVAQVYLVENGAMDGPYARYAHTPVFASDGTRLACAADGELVVIDLATRTETDLGALGQASELIWPDTGLHRFAGSGAARLVPGGQFQVPVQLDSGPNVFAAVAIDASGNRSGLSESIEVDLDTSALPDLAVSALVQPSVPVAGGQVRAVVTVTNRGPVATQGATVAATLSASDGTLRQATPVAVQGLAPGESAVLVVPLDTTALSGPQTLVVIADPSNGGGDADLTNNQAQVPFVIGASGSIAMALDAQPRLVQADDVITAQITLSNPGSPISGVLSTALVDPSGAPAVTAPDQAVTAAGASTTVVVVPLSVGRTLAGSYRVVAQFVGGAQKAASSIDVTVAPSTSITMTALTDRASYLTGEDVVIDSLISNDSLNAPLDGATYRLRLEDSGGNVVASPVDRPVPYLWMGGELNMGTTVSTLGLPPGSYSVSASVVAGGEVLSQTVSRFEIVGRALLVGSIAAASPGDPATPFGAPIAITLTIGNVGSRSSSSGVAHLVTVDPITGAEIGRVDSTLAAIDPASAVTWGASVSGDLPLGVYGLSLAVDHDGISEILAVARFKVVDGLAPALSAQAPSEGAFVRGELVAQVAAKDDASGTAVVRVTANDQASALTLQQGSVLDGTWTGVIHFPADGAYTLVFSAADAQGNDGLLAATAANPVTVHVVSDTVAPRLAIQGVTDGALLNVPVTPTLVAEDVNLARVEAELNGTTFPSGTTIVLDGDYVLTAQATDRAGNATTAGVRFSVDRTPPVIAVGGVFDGAYVPSDVTPAITVTDPHLDSYSVTLDGRPFSPGTIIGGEGPHALAIDARDLAGNVAARPVAFVIDKTPPAVSIGGFTNGELVNGAVSPTVTATDSNLLSVNATLNGAAFASGTPVSGDGAYAVSVVALDQAGNKTTASGSFTIDTTPPAIRIAGVEDGELTNQPVLPIVTVSDANLDYTRTVETLDGVTLLPGTVVSAEGVHQLDVTAYDLAGNSTRATIRFEIDETPPSISVNLADGAEYADPVTPTFGASDAHLGSVSATLNGSPFVSGTTVGAEGSYRLTVTARDLAGNVAAKTVSFTLVLVKYAVDKHLVTRQPRVLLRLPCDPAEARRIQSFLSAVLPDVELTAVQALSDLLVQLRSGVHDVVVLTDVLGAGGSTTCAAALPVPPIPAGVLASEAEQELTEAAHRGVGIVVLRENQAAWPKLAEALGTQFRGNELAGNVTLTSSAVSEAMQIAAPGGVQLEPGTASPIGWFAGSGDVAATVHGFGMGAAVVIGFDPSQAGPPATVARLVSGAVAFVTSEASLAPMAVAAVEISVTNEARPTTTRVRESLDPALQVVSIGGAGQRLPTGEIEWSLPQAQGQNDRFGYLVRLPSAAGTYTTSAEIAAVRSSGVSVWGEFPLALVLGSGAAELAVTSLDLAAAVPDKGTDAANRAKILSSLAGVQANPGATASEREQAIADLLSAIQAAKALRTVDPTALRLALDAQLAYWETRP